MDGTDSSKLYFLQKKIKKQLPLRVYGYLVYTRRITIRYKMLFDQPRKHEKNEMRTNEEENTRRLIRR